MRAPRLSSRPTIHLPRPTYANVMATLAVVLSLGTGTAYAAGLANDSVKARHISNDAVQARHILDSAVRSTDLASASVGSRAVKDESLTGPDLATGSVGARAVADGSLGASDLGPDSVSRSEIKTGGVESAEIADETIVGADIKEGAISSSRMTSGVKDLLFNAGVLAVDRSFGDVTVTNGSWPSGAPSSGAQLAATWTQPAGTIDVITGIARVAFPAACSASAATPRGLDVKITDATDRVVSASSPDQQDGSFYNGNGFWNQQVDLPGVPYRTPTGSTLADDPQAFVDYIHLPIEMAEAITGSSSAERAIRVFMKRSSSACSPVVTDARILVYRYTLP